MTVNAASPTAMLSATNLASHADTAQVIGVDWCSLDLDDEIFLITNGRREYLSHSINQLVTRVNAFTELNNKEAPMHDAKRDGVELEHAGYSVDGATW